MAKDIYTRKISMYADDGFQHTFAVKKQQHFESIQLTFDWRGLDPTGATVVLQEGVNDIWIDIPDLNETLSTASGTGGFLHYEFGNRDIRILVDFDPDSVGGIEGEIHFKLISKMR